MRIGKVLNEFYSEKKDLNDEGSEKGNKWGGPQQLPNTQENKR